MLGRSAGLTAALVTVVHAQATDYWFIPKDLTSTFCNGISRPDWQECEDKYIEDFINTDMRIGPDFLAGQTFTYDKCQIRYVQCTGSGAEWTMEDEGGMFGLARNTCDKLYQSGGVQRQGDLCIIVENPSNPYKPDEKPDGVKRDIIADPRHIVEQPAWPASSEEKRERAHAKDLNVSRRESSPRSLNARDECSGSDECYTYTEQGMAVNVRGPEQKVCDILPDGSSCAEAKSVTITDSYTVGFEISSGIKEVMDFSASFSTSYSEAVTTTLTSTLTIDCDGGSGYVVWYPLMEVSRGECYKGTCSGGFCMNGERSICSASKPIVPQDGVLSGEYDIVCI